MKNIILISMMLMSSWSNIVLCAGVPVKIGAKFGYGIYDKGKKARDIDEQMKEIKKQYANIKSKGLNFNSMVQNQNISTDDAQKQTIINDLTNMYRTKLEPLRLEPLSLEALQRKQLEEQAVINNYDKKKLEKKSAIENYSDNFKSQILGSKKSTQEEEKEQVKNDFKNKKSLLDI